MPEKPVRRQNDSGKRPSRAQAETTRKSPPPARGKASSRTAKPTEKPSARNTNSSVRSRASGEKQERSSVREKRSERDSRPANVSSSKKGKGSKSSSKMKTLYIAGGIAAGVALLILLVSWGSIKRGMLLKDLRDGNDSARASAARELAEFGDSARMQLETLLEKNPENWPDTARQAAAHALVLMEKNAPAEKKLAELATEGSLQTEGETTPARILVLREIVRCKNPERFPSEVFLKNVESKEPQLRADIAKILAKFEGAESVTALTAMLSDPEADVWGAAESSLKKIITVGSVGEMVALVKGDNPQAATCAKRILAAMEKSIIPSLCEKTKNESSLLGDVIDIFLQMAVRAEMAPALNQALGSSSIKLQLKALDACGKMALPETYETMLSLVKSPDAEVRLALAEAVTASQKPKLAEGIHPLFADADAKVRHAAIGACAQLKDYTATGEMIKLLDHADKETKRDALKALAMMYAAPAKRYKGNMGKWKAWWELYSKQLAFIDGMEKSFDAAMELLGKDTDSSKREVQKILEKKIAEADEFIKSKDLCLEIKDKDGWEYKRFDHIYGLMMKNKYASMKAQGARKD
jgi:HEAT repeat protein